MDVGADIFERSLCLPSDIKMTPTSKVCKKADCYLFDEDLAKYSKAAEYSPSKVIGDFIEQLD